MGWGSGDGVGIPCPLMDSRALGSEVKKSVAAREDQTPDDEIKVTAVRVLSESIQLAQILAPVFPGSSFRICMQ